MKYPKTVSTRAVNAISDWLVSRLEQLGVEAPHMYIRLLLSILQSTNDINDPTELNNLETFRASRKGGNRRNGEFDADAFKKFNAVQILKDIVSSEQEIATVEILIDELCTKLKDFERESESEDDDKLLNQLQSHQSFNYQQQKSQQTKEVVAYSKSCNATCSIESVKAENNPSATSSSKKSANFEEKNSDSSEYFRAFPALNKEMENSVNFWRRSAKWLPWPADINQRNEATSTSSASSSTLSSNSCADNAAKDVQNYTQDVATKAVNAINAQPINVEDKNMDNVEKNVVAQQQMMSDDDVIINDEIVDDIVDENGGNASTYGACSAAYGAIKRKSKRTRRNRALSKGKTNQQNQRKNPTSASIGGNGNKRSLSPSVWDTDFEGCWEMGRDLIKEFITSQNRNSRNRSTSESAVAYNKKNITKKAEAKSADNDENDENSSVGNNETETETTAPNEKQHAQQTNKKDYTAESHDVDEHAEEGAVKPDTPLPALLPALDISFCDYDDYDDTLATVSELTNDGPLPTLATGEGTTATAKPRAAKRLYERELQTGDTQQTDMQSDLAQFEAKFNSSIEALWKDADSGDDIPRGLATFGSPFNRRALATGTVKHYSGPTSLPLPFSQNLRNFWSNYYNHHFDLSTMLPTGIVGGNSEDINTPKQNRANPNGCDAIKPNDDNSNVAQVEENTTAPTSDYYSMPSNLDEMKRENNNAVCGDNATVSMRRGGTIGEERKTPIAPFFPNSIWSINANSGGGDTDESFYFKVHNSGRQLSQNDSAACSNSATTEQMMHQNDAIATTSTGLRGSNSFTFTAPYTTSKWSEGINAGPAQVNSATMPLTTLPQKHTRQSNPFRTGTDCTDSSASRAANWQLLAKSESIVDGQMHDTNAAGRSPCDSVSSEISLPNHSTRSGFVAYSRIKTIFEYKFPKKENTPHFGSFLQQLKLEKRREEQEAMRSEEQKEKEQKPQQQGQREQQQEKEQQQKDTHPMEIAEESENLLTSEKTHFHPIKFYPDGHTFDICSELDVVEYERSISGSLYFEQNRYLEYTRPDNFVVDDDHGIGASSNPLYANSNCEAATSANSKANKNTNKYSRNAAKTNRSEQKFVIRFRIQRNEIACQTDVEPPTARTLVSASRSTMLSGVGGGSLFANYRTTTRPHPLSLIFSNAAKNLKATATNELVYSDTAEAFTRAIAHFQPPPPPLNTASNSAWLPIADDAGDHSWNAYRQRQQSMPQQQNTRSIRQDANGNDMGSDEVDFYGNFADYGDIVGYRGTVTSANFDVNMSSLEQEWSMNQTRKRCREAGHMTANGNNNAVDCGAESVWDMCTACNNEMISIPANRLLRDELQMEGDEIMNDLRYMQDLYIGRAGDEDESDDSDDDGRDDDADYVGGENDDDVESVANTVTSDSDWCADEVTAEAADECDAYPNLNDTINSIDEEPAICRHMDMVSNVVNPNLNGTINSIDEEIAFHRRADLRRNAANTNLNDTVHSIEEEPAMRRHADIANNAANTNFNDTTNTIEEEPTESKNNVADPGLNDTINTIDEELAFHHHTDLATNAANPNINGVINSIDGEPSMRSQTDSIKNDDTATEAAANNDSETMTVIQKVNRLIAELLRPDNNSFDGEQMDKMNGNYGSNSTKGEEQPRSAEAQIAPTTQFRGNLWHNNCNERNIWQLSGSSGNSGGIISDGSVHSLKLLRQYNVKPAETAANADNMSSSPATDNNANDKYHTEMTWEHDNLARIWLSSTPLPPQLQPQTNTAIMTIKNISPLLDADENNTENDVKTDIAEKNMRNLRANADASVAAAAANLQLAQEFMVENSSHQNKVAAASTGAQLVDSALKIKAATRKRRHSASQNYFHAHFNSSGSGDVLNDTAANNLVIQNNNNNEIANLNNQILKSSLHNNCSTSASSSNANDLSLQNFLNASLRLGAAAAVAAVAASNTNMNSDYANNLCGANITFDCDSNAANGRNQTIITCQYHLTAIKPLGDAQADVNEFEVFTGTGNASGGGVTGRCGGDGGVPPFSNVIDKNPSILQHVTMTSRPLTR